MYIIYCKSNCEFLCKKTDQIDRYYIILYPEKLVVKYSPHLKFCDYIFFMGGSLHSVRDIFK